MKKDQTPLAINHKIQKKKKIHANQMLSVSISCIIINTSFAEKKCEEE
jgi:hypothetical protein